MKILHLDDLKELIQKKTEPCISIYIPTHVACKDVREDTIRLKNAIQQSRKQLKEQKIPDEKIDRLLQPLQALYHNDGFWQHQSQGLALYSSYDFFKYYRLPVTFEDNLFIDNHFYVKPLMPLFTANGRFYILTFSQHNVRLFEATRYNIHPLQLPPDTPTSIEELRKYDELQKLTEAHTTEGSGPQGSTKIMHAQGSEGDPKKYKKDILRFAQIIDRAVVKKLGVRHRPLLLGSVEYERGIYHQVNNYPGLVENGLEGNFDQITPEKLHKQAYKAIEPMMNQAVNKALNRYAELAGTGRTSSDIELIVPAANQGRIDTLFINPGINQWGGFDEESQKAQLHDRRKSSDTDLVDLATLYTLSRNGAIYALDEKQLPDNASAAAIFRY